jgi:hypothetical protein
MDTPLGADSNFLKPTLTYTIAVWWAWFWRQLLLSFAGISCALVLLVMVLAALHIHVPTPVPVQHPSPDLRKIIVLPVLLIGMATQVWAFQLVLKKTFKEFSIRLVKIPPEQLRLGESGKL